MFSSGDFDSIKKGNIEMVKWIGKFSAPGASERCLDGNVAHNRHEPGTKRDPTPC